MWPWKKSTIRFIVSRCWAGAWAANSPAQSRTCWRWALSAACSSRNSAGAGTPGSGRRLDGWPEREESEQKRAQQGKVSSHAVQIGTAG